MADEAPTGDVVEVATTETDEPLGENGLKALKAERERAATEKSRADALEQRLREFEDRDKSEEQKRQEERDRLAKEVASLTADRARLAVIARHQIPEDYHDLIRGDDEASLESAAAKVAALIAANVSTERATLVIPDEGGHPHLALNGDGIESALRSALGIPG